MGILIRGVVAPTETREPRHMAIEKREEAKFQSPDKLSRLHQWPALIAAAGVRSSGRTEWLLSLASVLAVPERPVSLADLTAERSFLLEPGGVVHVRRTMPDVRLLASDEEDERDPRSLRAEIERAIGEDGGRVILDIGSNALGGAVFGDVARSAMADGCDFLLVVNPFDPRTADADNVRALKIFVEEQARFPVTGLVVNPYRERGDEPRLCAEGAVSFLPVAQNLELPIHYVLADEEIAEKVSALLPGELPVWSLSRVLRAGEEEGADASGRDWRP